MSNALAIATVMRVLASMLDDAVTAAGVSMLGTPTTTVRSPDQITEDTNETSHLNLFLYLVAMNSGWKNVQLPVRNGDGARVGRPPLAVDLHFLLSGYGAAEYHQEVLLGIGMQALHETPFLDRAAIDATFSGKTGLDALLGASALSAQIELVKIAPHDLSADELYKLWNAFGSKARPSAAYVASVVLIESTARERAAPPVLQANVEAIPYVRPRIDAVQPAVFELAAAGSTNVAVLGSGFSSVDMKVQFGATASVAPTAVTPSRIDVAVPATVYPGINGVTVVRKLAIGQLPKKNVGASAPGYCIVRPAIVSITKVAVAGKPAVAIVARPSFDPKAGVDLLLDGVPGSPTTGSYVISVEPGATTGANVVFPVDGVAGGTYVVRIRAGGAESLPTTGAAGTFNGPTVTL
jgi:hypothetical protein